MLFRDISISSLTGKIAAQTLKFFCSSSLWTCLHHIVSSQNKITDFCVILAWASPFKLRLHIRVMRVDRNH